jgi:TolB protein
MKALAVLLLLATQDPIEKHIRTLSADAMEGRGLNTKGLDKAADYIEKELRAAGVQPAFGKSYRQEFPVKTGVSLGTNNTLSGVKPEDWTPLGFSSPGSFSGPIAFVGYGIDAPSLMYREYEHIDLKGKVALMLRYEPRERDDNSPFDGKRPSRWSAMRYKVMKARELGAVAVVFVTGPMQDEGKDKLPALANDGPESPAGIPVLQVKTSVAQQWVDLKSFQDNVDVDLRPRSRVLERTLSGTVDVKASFAEAQNVAGVIPGRGRLANEVVVVGAHYDHLGKGGRGSMRPNDNAIHNGADDNASGTAAVLVAARRLQELLKNEEHRRTVMLALFSAEEVGLGGSSYFVANPPLPLEKTGARINLDVVGALRDDKLVALGSESAVEWKPLVDRVASQLELTVTSSGDGYGPSDQTSFYAKQIPVLHFFTGSHERYHTPDDDADAVNFAGAERIAELTARVATVLARGDVTPKYARATSAPAMEGDSRGYGAYLGTIPDYSAMEATSGGVKLSDVRPGGPADKAGIRGGDVLVEMAGTRIENLYDMTYALQDHKPGETIDVVVLRGGERVTLRATLGSRGAQPAPGSGGHGTTAAAFEIKAGKPFEKNFDGERHLRDVRQLTFGGENAEAYFSPDGKKLIYQSTAERGGCDQQYVLDLATGETKLVSSGKGRTTCGYFAYPAGDRILYASTEAAGESCPPPPDRSRGYIWGVYPSFDIYIAQADGSNKKRITTAAGYDAEATWCHKGGKIIFTSVRDGDLDLYEMDENGGNVKRLTSTPGYDGGAFYNADCTQIVWRASRFEGAALDEYRALLKDGFVRPSKMELYVGNADGSNAKQITSNGAANFAPFFTPDGNRIIYSSNVLDPRGREFDLFIVNKDGSGEPERITTAPAFDGFPMFSPDGKWLVWGSNRANPEGRDTNLFIARWE